MYKRQTKALRTLILDTIRTVSTFAISNQAAFMEKVRSASQLRQVEAAKDCLLYTSSRLSQEKKEVDKVIINSAELEKYFGKDKSPREMKEDVYKRQHSSSHRCRAAHRP